MSRRSQKKNGATSLRWHASYEQSLTPLAFTATFSGEVVSPAIIIFMEAYR